MLYDPKWTKPDALSLAGLIAWLEIQPAGKRYNFCGWGNCLINQYLKSAGLRADYGNYSKMSGITSCGFVAARHPRTFGAALDRARKLAAAQ